MQTLSSYSFKGKKALIRVDYNVPLDEHFVITDDTRIRASVPTIKKILSDGGSVILMSHLGRPKDGPSDKYSLSHIVEHVSKCIGVPVAFANDCIGAEAGEKAKNLKPGEVLMLENLRFYKEEEKGDKTFAGKLADLGDVFVNDAFGTAHRAHASTTIVAEFFPNDKLFGYLIENELKSIDKVLHTAEKPYVAIVGGAKVSGKIQIISNLMDKVDHLIIGGGMTFTFIKALGGKVGASMVEEDKLALALEILNTAKAKGVTIHLPVDAVIADKFDNGANKKSCQVNEIPEGWMGLDIGPLTEKLFDEVIAHSKTILWNGPMGVFEMENFEHGTKSIAESVVRATSHGCFSLIGGGDSVAAINKYHLADKVSYVSTGGGALLEYMEGVELPGIKAIRGK